MDDSVPAQPLLQDPSARAGAQKPEPAKLIALRALLREMGSVLVCYSGGIDSALVLAVATQELHKRAIGMTAVSHSLPLVEQSAARRIAQELGALHRYVQSNEIARPGYAENGPDRCFHCKTELYSLALEKQAAWELKWVLNGTNTDDLGDYRPGLRAATDAQVRSPLVEVGMNKSDVRAAAEVMGISIWDKPAAACLSSRIPYGTRVTRERLAQVEAVETCLSTLGFRQARVRWHESVARIEVPEKDLPRLFEPITRAEIIRTALAHGFQFVTADLAGYKTGSLNALLDGRKLPVVRV